VKYLTFAHIADKADYRPLENEKRLEQAPQNPILDIARPVFLNFPVLSRSIDPFDFT
jgi:hypothetical protein